MQYLLQVLQAKKPLNCHGITCFNEMLRAVTCFGNVLQKPDFHNMFGECAVRQLFILCLIFNRICGF
mgnify:CR=1 FL=1